MSKLENLTKKILDDARVQAEGIKENARKKSEGVINTKIKEAHDRKDKIIEKANSEAEMMKDRVVSSAELKVRDEKLKAKQKVMDKVFLMAKESLKGLSEDEFSSFITKTTEKIEIKGKGSLVVPSGKKEMIESKIKDLEILEDENLESGFILKDDDVIYNYTFDSLVDEIREELEGEIAKNLFQE